MLSRFLPFIYNCVSFPVLLNEQTKFLMVITAEYCVNHHNLKTVHKLFAWLPRMATHRLDTEYTTFNLKKRKKSILQSVLAIIVSASFLSFTDIGGSRSRYCSGFQSTSRRVCNGLVAPLQGLGCWRWEVCGLWTGSAEYFGSSGRTADLSRTKYSGRKRTPIRDCTLLRIRMQTDADSKFDDPHVSAADADSISDVDL